MEACFIRYLTNVHIGSYRPYLRICQPLSAQPVGSYAGLVMLVPFVCWSVLLLAGAGCTTASAKLLKCHYFIKDHQPLTKNTSKTASDFFASLNTNLTNRMDNKSIVHVKGLALSNGWINYPTDLFLNGSNISSSFLWNVSWGKLLPELTSKMVVRVVQQVVEETKYGPINADAVLSIDYEPKYRPSWNFTIGEGAAHHKQPAWSALLEHIHSEKLDLPWISLVGWSIPGQIVRWSDLSKDQQRSLEEASWDYFVREYITTGIAKMKAEPKLKGLRVGFWDWPYKFWFLPAVKEAPPRWQQWMNELGWLWSKLDVFLPDLYPEFFAGAPGDKPSILPKCTTQNSSSTSWYYGAVLTESLRLQKRFQPSASVIVMGWYHYMCGPRYQPHSGPAVFVRDGNVEALFEAAAGAGGGDGAEIEIALWGSIGASPDDQMSEVRQYLDSVYAPVVHQFCATKIDKRLVVLL